MNKEKSVVIRLTDRELETIEKCIFAERIKLMNTIEHLKEHNATGENTITIRMKAVHIQELDELFDKLQEAEKFLK